MVIDRNRETFEEKKGVNPKKDWGVDPTSIVRQELQCLLGTSSRHHSLFLILATRLESTGSILAHPLYKITEAEVISYSLQPLSPAARQYANDLKAYLQSGCFYLTDDYSVTLNLTENKHQRNPFQAKFCWNAQFCLSLNESIQQNWLTPIIKGFAGSVELSEEVEMALLSRKSYSSAPCLRGLLRDSEDTGYSVETEVLVKLPNREFSYVQLRGTLPVPWEVGDRGVGVTKQPLAAYSAFNRYFAELKRRYGEVIVINLLSENSSEERITQAFLQLFSKYQAETSEGISYQALPHGLEPGALDASLHGYTLFGPGNQLLTQQRTVPRVNCLNCLSRTDAVMEGLAQKQLKALSISLGKAASLHLKNSLNFLWTQNSSALSDTQNSDFHLEPTLQSDCETIRICSWNLGGLKAPKGLDLRDWVGRERKKAVLVAVGLQEAVRLNAMNSLNLTSNFEVYMEWDRLLLEALNQCEAVYSVLTTVNMVGCYLAVFVLNEYFEDVSELEIDRVQAGFGCLGNKGAVAIRLKLRNKSICFLNCHLASGQENTAEREKQATKVLEETFRNANQRVFDHDIVYLFGDLNFRIDLPTETIFSLLRSVSVDTLRNKDQLSVLRRSGNSVLSMFSEPPLTFWPTYKFKPRDDQYDGKRNPAWTDRILYYGSHLEPLSYHSNHIPYSDHRPIHLVTALTT